MSGGGGRQTRHNCDSVRAGEIKPRRCLGEVEWGGGGDESDTSPVMITELGGRCTSAVQRRRERGAQYAELYEYINLHAEAWAEELQKADGKGGL